MNFRKLSTARWFVFTLAALIAVFPSSVFAQQFTSIFSMNGTNGQDGWSQLVQGTDGNLYGTTLAGGAFLNSTDPSQNCDRFEQKGCGTVYKVTPDGTLTTLHSFHGKDGAFPIGGLVQGPNGDLYGTTAKGGTSTGCIGVCGGTLFEISSTGELKTLHTFTTFSDGDAPQATLVLGRDGYLYGTTTAGGSYLQAGSIFKIDPSTGQFFTLHLFDPGLEGTHPLGTLIEGQDGTFYGTLEGGGRTGYGAVFAFKPGATSSGSLGGKLTVVYTFMTRAAALGHLDPSDGGFPESGLAFGPDGNLYGTTALGGEPQGFFGTVFKLTLQGGFTLLHSFDETQDIPSGTLVLGTDGNFYGTVSHNEVLNGSYGDPLFPGGAIFRITTNGTYTTLHNFNDADGSWAIGGLAQKTDGTFYGQTYSGGSDFTDCVLACGTVYSESVGLAPFVTARPTSGRAGVPIDILGTDLTGVFGVTFNGKAASFRYDSPSHITAYVPHGASSGSIVVKTSQGTLKSNTFFEVTK